MHRWKIRLIWIMAGYFLWGLGNDLFAIIPEFRFEYLLSSYRSMVFVGYALFAGLVWLAGMLEAFGIIDIDLIPKKSIVDRIVSRISHLPNWIRLGLGTAVSVIPTWILLYSTFAFDPLGNYLRLTILLFAAFIVSLLFQPSINDGGWGYSIFLSFLLVSILYFAGSYITFINAYPFSIGWSEGNRLWDYSMWLGRDRYLISGDEKIISYLSLGKRWISGIPFILPGIDIVGARLWDALIKILPALFLGYLAVINKPEVTGRKISRLFFTLWAFVFLLQGPIQPALVITAVITVLGVRQKNLVAASIIIMLAGYLASVSRFTWSYAPGLWAGMIVLMAMKNPGLAREKISNYFRLVLLGFSGYFGAQFLSKVINSLKRSQSINLGNISLIKDVTVTKSLEQTLIWERLLPNTTFAPGILLALLYAIVPLLLMLFIARRYTGWRLNKLQLIGVSFPLLAFLSVGIVASTKIGGGGDLHNLDMFLIGMVLVAANGWSKVDDYLKSAGSSVLIKATVYTAMCIPILYSIGNPGPLILPPREKINASFVVLREAIAEAKNNGEILFMDQRQLLTFGYFNDVVLVHEYEKKVLMDKSMESDEAYFAAFYEDLANHRFSIIITEPLFLRTGDFSGPFPDENDAWVTWVSNPLLRYYRVFKDLKAVGIQILVPRNP